MKILCIDQTGQLGGGEIALLPWLKASRDDVTMLLFEDGPFRPLLESIGVPVYVLVSGAVSSSFKSVRRESGLRSLASILPALFRLRAEVARIAGPFDLLYANSQKAFFVAALAKRRGQPLVWHLRDILTAEHFSPLMRRAAVWFGNRFATAILANSHATAEAWVAAGGDPGKVTVVHDGVSPEAFDKVDAATVAELRAGFGSAPVVGLFGRLSHWKGQHILLEALASLPGVHAILVGDALFGEDAYAEALKERVSQADLAGRVHFLGFRDDVPALMKSVDIVVHTSTAPEPFGLVIVEGMLAQKPVIATRAGGAIEIIADVQQGILIEPGSVTELKSAIESLLADPDRASRLALAGRRRAELVFSEEALIDGIQRELLRAHRP
jgi:glycosyltransferase involved in cell wall biosynthesis